MAPFKGTIALDIDGTITVDKHVLDPEVANFLNDLINQGWKIIFITGRTFSFALPIVRSIRGKFALAVQNGAALYQMPEGKYLAHYYINRALIPLLNEVLSNEPGGLLVESGKENGDICYYQREDFTGELLEYLEFRISISPENWKNLPLNQVSLKEFAVGKYYASKDRAYELAHEIVKRTGNHLTVIVIRDPFRPGHFLAHINHHEAGKGKILTKWLSHHSQQGPVIVAGDDYNDVEMLQRGDVKIVMRNAPAELHSLADIIAPPADQKGIISGIQEAIRSI